MSRSPDPLARYSSRRTLGSDATRRVLFARDEIRHRSVSLFLITLADGEMRKSVVRRARGAAALEHPTVAAIYEVGESEQDVFIVTEPLEALIDASDVVLLDVARALAAAHKRGIVHGALDGLSLWRTSDGETRVIGFGTGDDADPQTDVAALCALAGLRDATAFGSMEALLAALERAGEDAAATKDRRRARIRAWGLAGVAMLVAFAIFYVAFRRSAPRVEAHTSLDAGPRAIAQPRGQSTDPRANALFAAALQSRRDAAMPVARTTLDEALRVDPAFAAAHLYRAIWWYGIDDEARGHLARAHDLRANLEPRERTLLAAFEPLMRSVQDSALAIDRLTRAANDDPEDADLRFYTGVAHYMAGDFVRAIASMSDAYARDPRLAEALRFEAYFRAYIGDERAAALYEKCIDVSPAATHCMRGLAMVYRFAGRGQDAIALARRMIALEPSSSTASIELAEGLECVGASDDAVSEALLHDAALVDVSAREARALELRAKHAILHGRFSEALQLLDSWDVVIKDAAAEEAHFATVQKKVDVLLETGQSDQARRVIDAFLRRRTAWNPPAMVDNVSIIAWGQAYRASGVTREAFASHRESWLAGLAAKPSPWLDSDSRWVLAYAMPYRVERDASEAVAVLEAEGRGRAFRPSLFKDPNTYDGNLGLTLMRAGHPIDALPPLHRAASSCTAIDEPFEHIWARMAEGEALEALGRTGEACAAYRDVLAHWSATESRSSTAARARRRLRQCDN